MTPHDVNHLGQPIGLPLDGWTPPSWPPRATLAGRFCRVEPLRAARHADDLFAANSADVEGRMWTYLAVGPFATLKEYRAYVEGIEGGDDPQFHAIVDTATDKAVGVASYLRIQPDHGSIEVGHIAYSPLLQRTPAATEAMYLLMRKAFALGYRRYEWKCNALNAPSRAAALRLGFTFEGVFRQATIVRGRNRDTAWFSVIDGEWPAIEAASEQWLAPANFDDVGRQRLRLGELMRRL